MTRAALALTALAFGYYWGWSARMDAIYAEAYLAGQLDTAEAYAAMPGPPCAEPPVRLIEPAPPLARGWTEAGWHRRGR